MATGRVAILTDFGYEDCYVGVMKAVMLQIDPAIAFIDLTQLVPPQNLFSAAYLVAASWPWLPPGVVLLAVVDPGVGSSRRELILEQGGKTIVCPDNGLVTLVCELFSGAAAFRASAEYLDALSRGKPAYSRTFDGRDLFAPLAAEIARGNREVIDRTPVAPISLDGAAVDLLDPAARGVPNGAALFRARCPVFHVDHFGNCITGLRVELATPRGHDGEHGFRTAAVRSEGWKKRLELPFRDSFSAVPFGEPLAYWGSTGFLELAVRNGSFASRYPLFAGARVELELQ